MPAQSPTLSPTLSAMVAGLCRSSSRIPASTLPTRSPPTSAPLVKMPPPRRAKIEMSEAPKTSAHSASLTALASTTTRHKRVNKGALIAGNPHRPGENGVVASDAQERQAGDEQAGDGAGLEGQLKP